MFARAFTRKSSQENKQGASFASVKGEGATKRTRTFGRDLTNVNGTDDVHDGSKVIKSHNAAVPVTATDIDVDMDGDMQMDEERLYMARPSDDIDARDVDNPLLCTEYVNDMYDIFSGVERDTALNAQYMENQPFINEKMRAILCDWLVSTLHSRFFIFLHAVYICHDAQKYSASHMWHCY